ncbi:citrate/2-methylcitrate synthase, partial [Streptomyces sp. NPDC005093]
GIQANGGDVDSFIRKVKNKEDGVRLMGFGHRVYKSFDPRAKIIKAAAHDVLSALGKSDELLDIALKLEEHALSDEYFVSRNLYPNVDFYTGLIYRAMSFPRNDLEYVENFLRMTFSLRRPDEKLGPQILRVGDKVTQIHKYCEAGKNDVFKGTEGVITSLDPVDQRLIFLRMTFMPA